MKTWLTQKTNTSNYSEIAEKPEKSKEEMKPSIRNIWTDKRNLVDGRHMAGVNATRRIQARDLRSAESRGRQTVQRKQKDLKARLDGETR